MAAHQRAVVDAARDAGVRHVVKLSSIAADEPSVSAGIVRAHRDVERHIEGSGMAFTHLRPHWFMQNELGQAESIAAEGTLSAPDVGRISSIDARTSRQSPPGSSPPTATRAGPTCSPGPRHSTTRASPTCHRGHRQPGAVDRGHLADARDSMLAGGLPDELATGFTEIMARYREGGITERVGSDVSDILGRPPRSFADFAADRLAAFAAAAPALSR